MTRSEKKTKPQKKPTKICTVTNSNPLILESRFILGDICLMITPSSTVWVRGVNEVLFIKKKKKNPKRKQWLIQII